MKTARNWLGTKEAAAYLGVSVKFLYRHRMAIQPANIIGGRLRYEKENLDQWLKTVEWTPPPHSYP